MSQIQRKEHWKLWDKNQLTYKCQHRGTTPTHLQVQTQRSNINSPTNTNRRVTSILSLTVLSLFLAIQHISECSDCSSQCPDKMQTNKWRSRVPSEFEGPLHHGREVLEDVNRHERQKPERNEHRCVVGLCCSISRLCPANWLPNNHTKTHY